MAKRFCGDLTITIEYRDKTDDYRAVISCPRERPLAQLIRAAQASPNARDSANEYDSVAHAAVSFAMNETADYDARVDFNEDGNGFRITRKPLKAKADRRAGYCDGCGLRPPTHHRGCAA